MAKVDSVDGNKVTLSVGGGMGAAPDGNAPEKPDDNGDSKGGDSNVPEKLDDSGDSNNASENNGRASGVDSYDAVTEYAEDTEVDGESYSSTGTDENAILVSNGATATLKNITVDRTSSDSTGGDNSSFYGVGAAVLTTDGTTYLKNADITTNAAGGAGVFAYGDGIVYIADSDISTEKDTSGGIHAAGGGTLYAWDLNVETQGESSAAIRSDRGGGTMVVDGGTYTSNGIGSPADIAVNNATLTANGSEAICMEGLNTIHLFDCDITGDMQDLSQNDTTWTIIVYQSMSGDSEVGNSTMQIVGGSLTSKKGGLIYTTNTEANILLSDVDITYSDDSEITNLYNEGTIVDADGKTVSIVGTDGTVYVEGTSSYTITVEKYSDSADFSGAAEADSWTNHAVAKPEEIA